MMWLRRLRWRALGYFFLGSGGTLGLLFLLDIGGQLRQSRLDGLRVRLSQDGSICGIDPPTYR